MAQLRKRAMRTRDSVGACCKCDLGVVMQQGEALFNLRTHVLSHNCLDKSAQGRREALGVSRRERGLTG